MDVKTLIDLIDNTPVPETEADRVQYAGASTFDNPDGAVIAALNGIGPAGNTAQIGAVLRYRKAQARNVLTGALATNRFPQPYDPRVVVVGFCANLFTIDDPFHYQHGPEEFAGVSLEQLLAKEKAATQKRDDGAGPGVVGSKGFPR